MAASPRKTVERPVASFKSSERSGEMSARRLGHRAWA